MRNLSNHMSSRISPHPAALRAFRARTMRDCSQIGLCTPQTFPRLRDGSGLLRIACRSHDNQTNGASSVSSHENGLVVQQLQEAGDARAIAKIRADAYYEDQPTRFLETFKRQFAEAELRSLLQRTGLDGRSPKQCVCLLAKQEEEVVGTLDVYMPAERQPGSQMPKPPNGVPEDDTKAAYVNNLCVDSSKRRQGVGRALMTETAKLCTSLGLERIFVIVDADNEPAWKLYTGLGFEEVGESSAGLTGSIIGRRNVLRWTL